MATFLWFCALQIGTGLCSFRGSEPMQEDGPPTGRGDAPRGLFTPRWVEVQQTYGIERPQTEMYFHRLPPSRGILHLPPWERVVATHDLWPDELVEYITGWFYDLRGRSPNVEWWVRRAASSSMPLLQHVNYVLITSEDFHAFARNPHGLMELAFREPQLCTTVLPCLVNMPILRTFLAPLWAGMHAGITVRAILNGVTLGRQLVSCESGFYLRISLEGSSYLVSQIEHMASSHALQLHRPSTIFTSGYIHNRGTTVFIPGGNTLIMSRKVTLIGPNCDRDIESALRNKFPDLAQDNFGIGQVHSSYYLVEPVAHAGWSVQLVIPSCGG